MLTFYATKGIDFVMYDWYGFHPDGPAAALGAPYNYLASGDRYTASKVTNGLLWHKTSPLAPRVKFAAMLVADWFVAPKAGTRWGYQTEAATAVRALFDDPNYQRFQGKPVLGLFDEAYVDTGLTNETFLTHWPAIKAILGDVWLVMLDNPGTTNFTNFAGHAKGTYGNAGMAGNVVGRNSYSVYQSNDLAVSTGNDTRPLRVSSVSLTGSDVRPRGGNPAYCDYPAHDDLLATLRALASPPLGRNVSDMFIMNTADEFDEGELADPTVQSGSEVLDTIAVWKGLLPLAVSGRDGFGTTAFGTGTYTYQVGLATNYVTKSGGSMLVPAVALAGSYDSQEWQSSTGGDSFSITRRGVRFSLTCKQAADRGQLSVAVDGGAGTPVDLGAGSGGFGTTVWSSGALSNATHTVAVTVAGTHSAGSTNLVGCDRFRVTYVP